MLLEKIPRAKTNSEETEIDIVGLFNSFVLLLFEKRIYLLVTFIVGIVVGLTLFYLSKPVYQSQMTGYSESLKIEVVQGIIEDLQRTIEEKDYILAQKFLGLSKEKVKSIQLLSCRSAIEKSIYEKDESGIFIIEAQVTNLDVLDSLAFGLEHYLQQNEYV